MRQNYQVCTKLVVDTTDPDILFDADGVSNHYHNFHENIKPLWNPMEGGSETLHRIVDKIRKDGKGRDFDCILGMSGGADSSYMLHKMVTVFGLRPLVFHVDGGWNTELSVHNINCIIDKLRLDLFTEVINWEDMRQFQLAMFESGTPYLDAPQDIAFIGTLYKYARKYKIKYILNGGNIATESVGYPEQYYYFADMKMVRAILKRHARVPLKAYPFTSAIYRQALAPAVYGIRRVKPLNMMPYVKQPAMSELGTQYGWKPYTQKHFESRFTRFFEGYWLPNRFGYDVRRVQFSSLILSGQMTRSEALEALKVPPYNPQLIDRDLSYIASKLGIAEDTLRSFLVLPKKYYWDYPNNHKLFRMGERIIRRLTGSGRGGAY
jgi:N-acetyl sugar amidotransferase